MGLKLVIVLVQGIKEQHLTRPSFMAVCSRPHTLTCAILETQTLSKLTIMSEHEQTDI
jgi:hypothetical protein